ncbi:replication protein P [Spartinivicinus ruber]|uniref:replication protein P n=1 Tax=Spartinivicinus ruber TaxID=2683272 RepID=UPI0013D4FFF7|nr:replication protein P [Spartinivicinus ruber]
MKKTSDIISRINFNQPNTPQPASNQQDVSEHAAQLVNLIFRELVGIFSAWRQAFADPEVLASAKRNWTKGFITHGIHQVEQVRIGLNKARGIDKDFVPSVGTFIQWCQPQPEDVGLPEVALAYREACDHSHNPTTAGWSHEGVKVAAQETGYFELKARTEAEVFPLFKRNYAIVTRRVLAGESLTDIPKAITDQSQQSLAERNKVYHDTQQQQQIESMGLNHLTNAKDAMAAMRGMLGQRVIEETPA